MGPHRLGSLHIIKPTSKAIPAKRTATTNKSRTTTDKEKKHATGDTEDSNECNDQQNSDDEEVVDPQKTHKKRHHATDSSASEETTGVARKKGRRGSIGKQKGKAVEHIDDDNEDKKEGAGIIEIVGDNDENDAVVEEVSTQQGCVQEETTNLFISNRILICSMLRGFLTVLLLRKI